MLAKDTTLLESTEGSHVTGSKCKEITSRDKKGQWPSKKAKGKQLGKYYGNTTVKIGDANSCERCISTRQDCLVYYSR